MDEPRSVPMRRSLLLRLVALFALVVSVSVVATAWLTAHTTVAGLRETQGKTLRAGARIESVIGDYAATHSSWSQAGGLVRRLAASTGQQITVIDPRGKVLVTSSSGAAQVRGGPSTTIEPLDVPYSDGTVSKRSCATGDSPCTQPATTVGPPPGSGPIDPRATGPFALTSAERTESRRLADRAATCLSSQLGRKVGIRVSLSGRASVATSTIPQTPTSCDLAAVAAPLPSEVAPLAQLQTLLDRCLATAGGPQVQLRPDLGWIQQRPRTTASDRLVESCRTRARREQLAPFVAPSARLFVSRPRQEATTTLDLSPANRRRIAGVAALVLLVGLGVALAAGIRMVRPLSVLTGAAWRMSRGDLTARAEVDGQDEIGSLARAFNAMASQREQEESLRKAMVSDVAHELRNPVTTIRGALEAAQDGLVETDQALVTSLLEETVLLQRAVEDLRDLAAGDAGELRLAVEEVPVAPLVAQVIAAHTHDAERGDVHLAGDVDTGLVVDADALRLRQLVGNLVGNAIRHTAPGGSVGVTATHQDHVVRITVDDTGEGIAATDLPRVFDRFWRADPSRSRATGGTGLGLAIVRQLAAAHGGSVAVSSVPGVGTTFVVDLPQKSLGNRTRRIGQEEV